MKHGQDLRNPSSGDPPILSRVPTLIPPSLVQPQGGRLVEEDISRGHLNNRALGVAQEYDASKPDKQRANQNPFSVPSGLLSHASQVKGEEVCSKSFFWKLTYGITCYSFDISRAGVTKTIINLFIQLNFAYLQAVATQEWQKQNLPPSSQPSGE